MQSFTPRAVVFDFDGTLAELVIDFVAMRRAVAGVAASFFPAPPPASPLPVLEWIDRLAAALPHGDAHALHDQAHAAVAAIELEAADRGRLFPGVRAMLTDLRRADVAVGVITRNCRLAVLRVFPDLPAHCDVFLPREAVPRVKPDPEHLLLALRDMGRTPREAVMVGDHPLDMATGLAAGVAVAGVTSGRSDRAALEAAGARQVAEGVVALARGWLERA